MSNEEYKKRYQAHIEKWIDSLLEEGSKKFYREHRGGEDSTDTIEMYPLDLALKMDPFAPEGFTQNKFVLAFLETLHKEGKNSCDKWLKFLRGHCHPTVTGIKIELSYTPNGLGLINLRARCHRCNKEIELSNPDSWEWA